MMDSTSFYNLYLSPFDYASRFEPKPMKAEVNEKDIVRFESIIAGEETYMPKSLAVIIPATDPNAVQRLGSSLINRVCELKKSVNGRFDRIGELFQNSNPLNLENALKTQWELTMFSVETSLLTNVASKAGEGVKTLFRNQ